MTTFAIIAPAASPGLKTAVERVFPASHYEFGPGQFVVATNEFTAQGVTLALGAGDGEMGSIVVFGITGYWGFHTKGLWDWISARGTPS